MVQIQKAQRKTVYKYLLQEGVVVIHKDFTQGKHKGTEVPNIVVRLLLRSLKDRGMVNLIFNWQYFYYFLDIKGKQYLSEFLGLAEEVVPQIWKKDAKRNYEHLVAERRKAQFRADRPPRPNTDGLPRRGAPRRPVEGFVEKTTPVAPKA